MRPICGCGLSYDLPSSHRPVPSHSLAARSTTRNRLADYSCLPALPLRSSDTTGGAKHGGRSLHPVSGVLGIPWACGLASLSPLIRYERRGDDVPGVSICGRYRWQAEAFHIRGSFISIRFRSRSPTPFRPALRLSDMRNGTGLICRSSSRCPSVSRSYRLYSGR